MRDNRWNSEDPYIRAIARGRAITSALARLVADNDRGGFWVDMRSVLSGGQPLFSSSPDNGDRVGQPIPDTRWQFGSALNHVWHYHMPQFEEDHPLA
jgi:hypothetical protein